MTARGSSLARVPLVQRPSPVDEMARLRQSLGGGPRLLVKRDDALEFAFGGNKVRKMALVAAEALAAGADTLISCGGLQSNHARVTAITAARLGLRCVLVLNVPGGRAPDRLTGNPLLSHLAGADLRDVASRDERDAAMRAAAEEVHRAGGRPYVIPLGASTPLGAAAFSLALDELLDQVAPPDVIVHASSSGATQAGLVAGCLVAGVTTRVIGISADATSSELRAIVQDLLTGAAPLVGLAPDLLPLAHIEVDDSFIGDGYGVPTAASHEALHLAASTEGVFVDHSYTAKALAGLIALVRAHAFSSDQTVLFWHTGGQVGLFA
jgi:1-aminocyclopropane-1-carboxylate deaminase/D-cysteine desulfhydrase-like pyridoxal-dependent ACC family enzyme